MQTLGALSQDERDLLITTLQTQRQALGARWQEAEARGRVFWINLPAASMARGEGAAVFDARLDAWVRLRKADWFARDDVSLDGYGFTVNPVGSRGQRWHLDYHNDYANVFIPLTRLSSENAVQFIDIPPNFPSALLSRACADPDDVDIGLLASHTGGITVSQVLVPPFTIQRMDFGTIHRGVANTGRETRVMFFLSVRRGQAPSPPAEPDLASSE